MSISEAGWLVRWLPHRCVRSLSGVSGRSTALFQPARKRRALHNLECAFPELDASARAELAQRAAIEAAACAAEGASLRRFDGVGLCRRLALDGWRNLDAAQDATQGTLILVARCGLWQLAALTVGLYRGPLTVVGRASEDSLLRGWSADLAGHHGQPVIRFEPSMTAEAAGRELGQGGLVAGTLDPGAGGDLDLSFLGRDVRFDPFPVRAALAGGAAILPVFARPADRGAYRVEIGESIRPLEAAQEDIESLLRRCLEPIEQAVLVQPELWPWHCGHGAVGLRSESEKSG
ncbi:MAG: hypothetical protein AAF657_01205 [Acidobacteriota bacterium]